MKKRLFIGSLSLLTASCASLQGGQVDKTLDQPGKAEGVSYFLAKPTFSIERKTLSSGKAARPTYDIVIGGEPDANLRFEVGMKPGWFSSDSFEIRLSDAGVIDGLNSSSTDVTGSVVAELGKFAVSVVTSGLFAKAGDWAKVKTVLNSLEAGTTPGQIFSAPVHGKLGGAGNILSKVSTNLSALSPTEKTRFLTACKEAIAFLSSDKAAVRNYEPIRRSIKILDGVRVLSNAGGLDPSTGVAEAQRVVDTLELIRQFEAVEAAGSGSSSSTSKSLAALSKSVSKALDACVSNMEARKATTPDAALKASLDTAIARYRAGVKLVLEATEKVGNTTLVDRATVLNDFLNDPIPTDLHKSEHTAYIELADELRKVEAAISAMTRPAKPTDLSKLPLANQVTSRISENVHVTRFKSRLTPSQVEQEVKVGQARVRFGGANAAIFTQPTAN